MACTSFVHDRSDHLFLGTRGPSSFGPFRPSDARLGEKSSTISNDKLRRNPTRDLLCLALFRLALPLPATATRKLATRCLQAAQPSSPDLSKQILAWWPK